MDKEVRKKLAQMGGSLIKKDQQTKKLKNLGKDRDYNLDKIFDNVKSALDAATDISGKDNVILVKLDKVLDLIKINIKLSAGHSNFDIEEYKDDKNKIFNIKSKYLSTGIKPAKDALKDINKIFNKHKRISKLLSNK